MVNISYVFPFRSGILSTPHVELAIVALEKTQTSRLLRQMAGFVA